MTVVMAVLMRNQRLGHAGHFDIHSSNAVLRMEICTSQRLVQAGITALACCVLSQVKGT